MIDRKITVTARPTQKEFILMAAVPCALKATDRTVSILYRDPRMWAELARHSARVQAHIVREEGHDSNLS